MALFRHPLRGLVRRSDFFHGFEDSPVTLFRHPLRGFPQISVLRTGSQTPPCLMPVPLHDYTTSTERTAGRFPSIGTPLKSVYYGRYFLRLK
jgi:hypothetical protein